MFDEHVAKPDHAVSALLNALLDDKTTAPWVEVLGEAFSADQCLPGSVERFLSAKPRATVHRYWAHVPCDPGEVRRGELATKPAYAMHANRYACYDTLYQTERTWVGTLPPSNGDEKYFQVLVMRLS